MRIFSAMDDFEPRPFDALVTQYSPCYFPKDLPDSGKEGVLVIWGGGDISPSYYKQKPGSFTGAGDRPGQRDRAEAALAQAAIERGMPIIGVCRGAQLLCSMAGGKLVQHVKGHGSPHPIETRDGREMESSSLHHQMMYPWDIEHELFAWCPARSSVHLGENDEELSFPTDAHKNGNLIEPEIVWFPQVKTLAIQGHPEFMNLKTPFVQYSLELMAQLCL